MIRGWLIGLGVAVALWLLAVVGLAIAGRRTAAREVARLLPNLVVLFRGLIRDPRTPRKSKALLFFAAAWVVSPIDLIPEFVPFLGPLDDAVMAALVLRQVVRAAGPDLVREHWPGEATTLERVLRLAGVGTGEGTGR